MGQTPMSLLIKRQATVNNPYPTFVSENETAWNSVTSPKTTASIAVNNGDVLVAYSVCEGQGGTDVVAISGGGLTWTLAQSVSVNSYTLVYMWTTTATSTTSFAVTFTHTGNTLLWYGGDVLVFRDSNGIGASNKTNIASGGPSLALTTTANNSAIVCVSGDWTASDGAVRTWRTINSITPTAGNNLEQSYFRDAAHYTIYGGYWSDVGTAGSKTTGISSPSAQKYSIISIEVKGN